MRPHRCVRPPCLALALVLAWWPVADAQAAPPDSAAAVAAVQEYNEALRRGAPDRLSAVLGPSLMMFNGAHSGEPRDWEVHMYLAGADLAAWPGRFVPGAAPHENRLRVVRVDVRGNAALVVTEETGRNKFREWKNEEVGYLLGRDDQRWKIVGYFIRDIANPK